MKQWIRLTSAQRRQKRIRKKVFGTKERPRLSVFRSINHMSVQLIDDAEGKTLYALSTASPAVKEKVGKNGGNVKGASLLGEALAVLCKEHALSKVVFDRAGCLYHGRVKALAEAARKGGLSF